MAKQIVRVGGLEGQTAIGLAGFEAGLLPLFSSLM